MTVEQQQAANLTSIDKENVTGTLLSGRWLAVARVVWMVIALLALGLYIASFPTYFAFLRVICTGTLATCRSNGQITPGDLRVFQAASLSLDFFAVYWVTVYIVFTAVYIAIGAVVFWRRSDDRMALFASLALVTLPAGFNNSELATLPSALSIPAQIMVFLGNCSIFIFFYLFPDGRFVPRWTRWLSVGVIILWAVYAFFPAVSSSIFISIIVFGFVCSALVAQTYRYRRVSSVSQRQQTKWVVFGISIGLSCFLVLDILWLFLPSLVQGTFANLITGTPPTFVCSSSRSRLGLPSYAPGSGTSTSSSTARWSTVCLPPL